MNKKKEKYFIFGLIFNILLIIINYYFVMPMVAYFVINIVCFLISIFQICYLAFYNSDNKILLWIKKIMLLLSLAYVIWIIKESITYCSSYKICHFGNNLPINSFILILLDFTIFFTPIISIIIYPILYLINKIKNKNINLDKISNVFIDLLIFLLILILAFMFLNQFEYDVIYGVY